MDRDGGTNHDSARSSYDKVAEEYQGRFRDELTYKPLDRALLGALVEETPSGEAVADIGCGPGHVSGWLAGRGVRAVGIDISAQMVAVGRREHPDVEFRVGDFLSLPAKEGEFAAAVALYSIIHLEPPELRAAFEEVHRVLRPSGIFLVSFHMGSETRHVTELLGREVYVVFRFYESETVIEALELAGFSVDATLERTNYPEESETRRAYLHARRY